jgi:hypothetical protein
LMNSSLMNFDEFKAENLRRRLGTCSHYRRHRHHHQHREQHSHQHRRRQPHCRRRRVPSSLRSRAQRQTGTCRVTEAHRSPDSCLLVTCADTFMISLTMTDCLEGPPHPLARPPLPPLPSLPFPPPPIPPSSPLPHPCPPFLPAPLLRPFAFEVRDPEAGGSISARCGYNAAANRPNTAADKGRTTSSSIGLLTLHRPLLCPRQLPLSITRSSYHSFA